MPSKTLAQQLVALARMPVTIDVRAQRRRLRWTGALQPTPVSAVYVVRMDYRLERDAPEITVLRPKLREPGVEALPHVYLGDRLCLCYPHQWDAASLVADTLVPWTAEWLVHFEIWKLTGEWRGGGHEPAVAEVARE